MSTFHTGLEGHEPKRNLSVQVWKSMKPNTAVFSWVCKATNAKVRLLHRLGRRVWKAMKHKFVRLSWSGNQENKKQIAYVWDLMLSKSSNCHAGLDVNVFTRVWNATTQKEGYVFAQVYFALVILILTSVYGVLWPTPKYGKARKTLNTI